MRTCLTTTTLSTLLGLVILTNPAAAADPDNIWAKENWMFRLRAIDVAPDESSKVNIGGMPVSTIQSYQNSISAIFSQIISLPN